MYKIETVEPTNSVGGVDYIDNGHVFNTCIMWKRPVKHTYRVTSTYSQYNMVPPPF